MMGFELPAVSAIVARLPDPAINLAAYGGVVFPLSLVIEAPIIMLLAASTALSRDWPTYLKLRRFMIWSAVSLTAIHVLVAFTPLFYFVVGDLLGAPEAIREPARLGLMIMTPWTGAIAYRRFQQGVLIRFNRSRLVGVGTAVRLGTNLAVLLAGFTAGGIPGIVVGTCAVAAGVTAEAVFIGFAVRPVLRGPLRAAAITGEPLTLKPFLSFYVPLAMTPLLTLLAQPIVSAALGRLPRALDSLAVWPVISGLVFTLRSLGLAYNEVVVALLDEPGARHALFRFTVILSVAVTLVLFLITVTPLGWLWFAGVSGLEESLARLARTALWIALPIPGLSVFLSWYQGLMVHSRRTRGITESVALYLAANAVFLGAAVRLAPATGVYLGLAAVAIGVAIQAGWLRFRSGPALARIIAADPPPRT
jgi:hypothetical protein